MHLADLFTAAHDTWLGVFARSNPYIYTIGLIVHFTGLALLMGAILLIDITLLGFARTIPPGAALKLLPVAILGFVLNLLTGVMFFCFDPERFGLNPAFQVKMLLVLLAGLNALWFTLAEHREVAHLPAGATLALKVRISAAISLTLWFGVIVAGRMIVAFQ
ncbi:MAG: hypothetical protein WB440_19125 [Steroidobacteraceae bacterium]|jgi:hypothetical protein